LRIVEPHLRLLKWRGIPTQVVLGIDGGIATEESLALALELFQEVIVFHDPGPRTFHPKVYAVETASEVVVSVGSSNLTEGGLYRNYEGNVLLRLQRGLDDDEKLYADLVAYRDQLRSSDMPCRKLTRELLDEIVKTGSLLRNEQERQQLEQAERARAWRVAETLFGTLRVPLPPVPRRAREKPPAAPAVGSGAREGGADDTRVLLRWWKRLTRSDAIRKDQASHQRNYIILGKAGHDIDQKTWFRDVFFDRLTWQPVSMRTGNTKERATHGFQVLVNGEQLGTYEMSIDHAPNRIADQNNAPTWLHWSSLLDVVRQRDFTGWYLVLEKLRSSYRLQLSTSHPAANE
jgi:hypothetical protein